MKRITAAATCIRVVPALAASHLDVLLWRRRRCPGTRVDDPNIRNLQTGTFDWRSARFLRLLERPCSLVTSSADGAFATGHRRAHRRLLT